MGLVTAALLKLDQFDPPSSSGITALDVAKVRKRPSVAALLEAKLAELRAGSSSK